MFWGVLLLLMTTVNDEFFYGIHGNFWEIGSQAGWFRIPWAFFLFFFRFYYFFVWYPTLPRKKNGQLLFSRAMIVLVFKIGIIGNTIAGQTYSPAMRYACSTRFIVINGTRGGKALVRFTIGGILVFANNNKT